MKKYFLLISVFFIGIAVFSQTRVFDAMQNTYGENADRVIKESNVNSTAASVNIDCGAGGKFWTVSTPPGAILEWQLSDTTITFLDTLFATSPVSSLSYCNLFNSGSIQTTLYGSEITTVSWYNGTSWNSITPSQQYTNSGGCGRFLYFMRSGAMGIDRYNGTTFTNIITLQNAQFTIADLAVDTGGKIWSLVSKVSIGDTLAAIDSAGNIVKRYAISPPIDENNAYGCFLMDSILYIGIGKKNTTYPNTIIPIRIYSDTAIEGNPILFQDVDSNLKDMASCTEPLILAFQNYMNANAVTLYPNPATDQLILRVSQSMPHASVLIFNTLGQIIFSNSISLEESKDVSIDITNLPAGVYFLRFTSQKENYVGKFAKE